MALPTTGEISPVFIVSGDESDRGATFLFED
jgi:hypothetical protein